MTIKRIDYPQITYLSYERKTIQDFEQFKKELLVAAAESDDKDIVVDLTGFNAISSPEVGAIVRMAERLKNTSRHIRIIPSPSIHKTLLALNLDKLENLVLYESKESFIAAVKNAAPQHF